jgi:tetratricopeptide (TPR) repeat protein
LKIRKAELGDEHEKVADAYVAIGNVQSDMEKRKSAMSSYQEALQIRRRLFGPQDESVAAVLQYMGTLEFHAKRLDRALQLLNDFINIREGLNTERDGDYVNVLFMIGNIHKMEGDEEQAQSCWTEAYRVFKELGLQDVNPEIAKVMGDMVGNSEVSTPHNNNRDSNQDQGEMFREEPPSRSSKKGSGGGLLGKLKRTVKKVAKGSGGQSISGGASVFGGGGSGGQSISGGASVFGGGGGGDANSVADESAVTVEKKRLGMRRKRDKGKGQQL